MIRYLLIPLLVLSIVACTQQLRVDVSGVGETVPTGPSAIAWDGKNLIIAKEGLISFLDNIDTATTGSIYGYEGHYFFDRYPITITSNENAPNITGLAWEKSVAGTGYIWVTDGANRRLLKISPKGDIQRKLSLSAVYPEDMTFDGEFLWIVDSKRSRIFKISPIDASVVAEYQSPIKVPTALAWDGKYLIIGGISDTSNLSESAERVSILKLEPQSGRVVGRVFIPKHFTQHISELSWPLGMAWINDKIWISDRNSGKIIVLSDWTETVEDPKNYKLATTTPTVKKLPVKEAPTERDIEEAKRAAEEAKKAAEEAKKAAEAAKKAFELQQKK